MTVRRDSARLFCEIVVLSDLASDLLFQHPKGTWEGSLRSQPNGLTHFQLTFPLFHFSTFPLPSYFPRFFTPEVSVFTRQTVARPVT